MYFGEGGINNKSHCYEETISNYSYIKIKQFDKNCLIFSNRDGFAGELKRGKNIVMVEPYV